MIDIIGIGPCVNGQYNTYEVNGSLVEAIWINPWGIDSVFSICEVNGCRYDIIGIGACDQYGRFAAYEVNGRVYDVNWIDRLNKKTPQHFETYVPTFLPPHFFRKIGIILALLIALLSGCANEQIVETQENGINTSRHELDERLTKIFLKSANCNKLSLSQITSSQKLDCYKFTGETRSLPEVIRNNKAACAKNMKARVLGKNHRYY